jgi:hypothetical protein
MGQDRETIVLSERELSEEELQERVAILKRFREMLLAQREKFRKYLRILEHQEEDIANDDIEKLQEHANLEREVIGEIETFQKVIDPLETMYRHSYPQQTHPEKHQDIEELRRSLDSLQEQALAHNAKNRELLNKRMQEINNQLLSIKRPQRKRSLFHNEPPTLVDITT